MLLLMIFKCDIKEFWEVNPEGFWLSIIHEIVLVCNCPLRRCGMSGAGWDDETTWPVPDQRPGAAR